MEGVEDIPGPILHEGLDWRWESFPEYLDALDARPRDIDICALLPHGALRVHVMGARGLALENANQGDIAQMRAMTAEAVRAGAFGVSTSRTISHRTLKGDPTPTLRAQEEELRGLAHGLRDGGGGLLELVSDWNTPDPATEFAIVKRVVEATGQPVVFSLTARHDRTEAWRELLALSDAAAAKGCRSARYSRRGRSASCSACRAARTRSRAAPPTRKSPTCPPPRGRRRCAMGGCARASCPRTASPGRTSR